MSKVSNMRSPRIKEYRDNLKETGFSLLEAVIIVGILFGLAISGFFIYGDIRLSTKKASVETAASTVYTAALAAEADGDPTTTADQVESNYNNSQNSIHITITVTE